MGDRKWAELVEEAVEAAVAAGALGAAAVAVGVLAVLAAVAGAGAAAVRTAVVEAAVRWCGLPYLWARELTGELMAAVLAVWVLASRIIVIIPLKAISRCWAF